MKALARFIRWVMRDTRYHVHYPATVELVHNDDSFDVTPDDDAIRGTGLASLRPDPGVPCTVRPEQGARCLVGFKAGDPERPYISSWESGGLGTVSFDEGTAGVAGLGNLVEVLLPEVVTIEGFIDGAILTPPPPATPTAVPMMPILKGVATVPPGTVTAVVQGGRPDILV